jgi:hypothetical protein
MATSDSTPSVEHENVSWLARIAGARRQRPGDVVTELLRDGDRPAT